MPKLPKQYHNYAIKPKFEYAPKLA